VTWRLNCYFRREVEKARNTELVRAFKKVLV